MDTCVVDGNSFYKSHSNLESIFKFYTPSFSSISSYPKDFVFVIVMKCLSAKKMITSTTICQ